MGTLRRKKSKFGKILGHQKGSNFPSVYIFFASAPSPYGEKNPNSAKSWGIKKGQIFPQYTLFLRLHHHPTAKKIQIRQNLGASKRVKFSLSIHFFCVCTITPWRKKSKCGKILGHQKGSNFGSAYTFFAGAPSPYGKKNPNSAKSWGIPM